jgi:hypothetical protein
MAIAIVSPKPTPGTTKTRKRQHATACNEVFARGLLFNIPKKPQKPPKPSKNSLEQTNKQTNQHGEVWTTAVKRT